MWTGKSCDNILATATVKIAFFCTVTQYSPVDIYRRFRLICSLRLHGTVVSDDGGSSMSETSVNTRLHVVITQKRVHSRVGRLQAELQLHSSLFPLRLFSIIIFIIIIMIIFYCQNCLGLSLLVRTYLFESILVRINFIILLGIVV